MNFLGCYSSSFRIWDEVFGTDSSYKKYKLKQAEAKKQGKQQRFELVRFLCSSSREVV
jgi:methylsterol monooxygenase